MKKQQSIYLILIFSLSLSYTFAQSSFITTWKTDYPGTSGITAITIPTKLGETYNYSVDWGDGTTTSGETSNASHNYGTSGTYQVQITGIFPRIHFNNTGDCKKIINVNQWGDIEWSSMEEAFYGCENMASSANDAPDLTDVTSLNYMFKNAGLFNGNVSSWDVSHVEDMEGTFMGASSFNQNLGIWDIENVWNMYEMLDNCGMDTGNYDQTLEGWAAQQVNPEFELGATGLSYCNAVAARNILTDTYFWFIYGDTDACSPKPLMTLWKTNNPGVSDSTSITIPTFLGANYLYDVDWDGDDVIDDYGYTGDATHDYNSAGVYYVNIYGDFPRIYFNDTSDKEKIVELLQWGDIEWTSMHNAFMGCKNLVLTASDAPDLSSVTSMKGMFLQAESFNHPLNSWDVSSVMDMEAMFHWATAFNQNLGDWDIHSIADMAGMLDSCGMSINNYDSTLIGWQNQVTQDTVELGVIGLSYCDGFAARYMLENFANWTIIGDTFACPNQWVVNTGDSGTGSLREALDQSNANDTIKFSPGLFNDTIRLTSTILNFEHNLYLLSNLNDNITIDASLVNNAFHASNGVDVLIEGLKVICGNSTNTRCIENSGNLIITDVEFSDSNGGASGESIKNNNTITIKGNVKIE